MAEVNIPMKIEAIVDRCDSCLKTHRCELCGEVYYSDEVKTKIEVRVDHGDHGETYGHICPTCAVTIQNVLMNPGAVDAAINDKYNAYEAIEKMRTHMISLHTKLCRWFYTPSILSIDPNYVDNSLTVFEDRYQDVDAQVSCMKTELEGCREDCKVLTTSRNCWRASTLGLLVGMFIGLVLRFVF